MNKHRTQPKFQIFEHDSYDFNVYTDKKLDQKINYIEVRNPIKHRLIKTEEELEKFRWSSYRCRYLGDNSVIKIDFAGMLEI